MKKAVKTIFKCAECGGKMKYAWSQTYGGDSQNTKSKGFRIKCYKCEKCARNVSVGEIRREETI